jgi:hypothetical protein
VIALSLALALAAAPAPAIRRPDLRAAPSHAAVPEDTRCAACHTEESWTAVRFAHERTGFPLEGRHLSVGCKACHPAGFTAPVKGSCAACHRDPHAGELGVRCAGCHDADSWRARFDADAHRRTNFPLSGRHAFIPCEECHGDRRDKGFSRTTVECVACHGADYARTGAGSVDHAAIGFGTRCRECHSAWRFSDAVFPAHDRCFLLSAGPHARVRCLDCHTQLLTATVSACNTGTAACTRCHACSDMSARHAGVLGFQCSDRKCYECHRFARAAALRGAPGGPR